MRTLANIFPKFVNVNLMLENVNQIKNGITIDFNISIKNQ